MSEVLICPVGAIEKASIRSLRKAGVVVVETNEPERCQFIRAGEIVGHRDLLWAALSALQVVPKYNDSGQAQRQEFTRLVFGIVDTARRKQIADTDQPDESTPVTRGEP